MRHEASKFMETDCKLLRPMTMFLLLHKATNGDPCTTGCAYYDGGRCPDYRKLNVPAKPAAQQEPMETVRETAARLGISISEVRRRRRATTS